jgi:hypothetical protein
MKTIIPHKNIEYLAEAVEKFKTASCPAALTGAGISVNSGIADFRLEILSQTARKRFLRY